ncbi:MAG TPA: hypothetical protein VFS36_08195 [Chitinophagaceae bacterium]|nr:hypothetical protein [Chitinophagaceae bacterium]
MGGLIMLSSDQSFYDSRTVGTIMVAGGGAAMVTGAVFLSSAKSHKNKAGNLSLAVKMEKSMKLLQKQISNNYYPAAIFTFRLGQ